MTQKDIISTIQTAKEQFANYNGEFGSVVKNTEIVLCSRKTMDRLRSEALSVADGTDVSGLGAALCGVVGEAE